MPEMNEKQLAEQQETETQLSTQTEAPMGFEDDDESDFIVPRIKVINALSPERKDKIADEGDIINSLTKENLNGKIFVPVFKYTNIILWKPRDQGGGIAAIANDGKICVPTDGGAPYACAHLAEFDNTKQGKDAQPTHTKYMNFFGFFEGERYPIVLSFAKTNYREGKQLYSLAKVTMQNMWNHGYALVATEMKKNGNEWFNIGVRSNGPTSAEDREFALSLYKQFKDQQIKMDQDMGEDSGDATAANVTEEQVKNAEF